MTPFQNVPPSSSQNSAILKLIRAVAFVLMVIGAYLLIPMILDGKPVWKMLVMIGPVLGSGIVLDWIAVRGLVDGNLLESERSYDLD